MIEQLVDVRNKDDAFNILDRIIGFINSCDTKAFGVLGVYGIGLAILLSTDGILKLKEVVLSALTMNALYSYLYLFALLFTLACFSIGIFKLLMVFLAKIDCDDYAQAELNLDSVIYFKDIAKKDTFIIYKDKFNSCKEEDFLNDILSQIYINSKICTTKYKNYREGFIISICGSISFVVIWFWGILIF